MLNFADDIVLTAENEKDLDKLIRTIDETFNENLNMKINKMEMENKCTYSYVEGKVKPEYK